MGKFFTYQNIIPFVLFQIIPLRQSDVDLTVSNFRALPDELRRNVPDLLLACMSAIFAQYKKAKVGSKAPTLTYYIIHPDSYIFVSSILG